jgi:biotin carboxyl carrier protein
MPKVCSNVSGTIIEVLVKVGDKIEEDQDIVSIESMKMEMMVPSTESGVVKEILVSAEDFVQEGQALIVVE